MVEATPAAEEHSPGVNEAGDVQEPNVYEGEGNTMLNGDDVAFEYTVKNPVDFHGHVVYEVKGKDTLGDWECKRRYNEFFLLYECLAKRWPGIPLPVVPPKKAMGSKDQVFIQERRFYLERYLRKLSKFEFVIQSQEF